MKYIHFIAVGGAIMHQLAIALKKQGYVISGSDDEINDPAKSNLAAEGILPEENGWFPEKITGNLDAIVLGMHARADNPELLAAKKLGIPIYSFPQYIYEVSKDKKRVVIAGSHGKTTITSMVMHILKENGVDFDYMVGARVPGFKQSVKLGDAPVIVLEGDEYPASVEEKRPKIFFYHPDITVISGIAWDHINVFPTYDIYRSQFEQYLGSMGDGKPVIYNNEDIEVQQVIKAAAGHLECIPYNMPAYHYEHGEAVLDTSSGPVPVSIFGSHNLLNIQAAINVCLQLGVSLENCYKAIGSFTGAAKRLEKLLKTEKLVVYRDFAHAPSKLKATLDAVKEAYHNQRLIAIFELHTYSSLNEHFLQEYAGSMNAADVAIVYFSHHALELKGLPGLDTQTVKKYFGRDNLEVIDNRGKLEQRAGELLNQLEEPTCLLLMSSGTFDGIDWNSVSSHQK